MSLTLISALVVGACGSTSNDSSGTFSSCYSNLNPGNSENAYGSFAVSSDIWNPTAATTYSQCTNAAIELTGGVTSARFDWNFVSSNGQVKTYPNLQFGWQPGNGSSTTPLLPVQVSSMSNFNVTGAVTTQCTTVCTYNTGFDIFFSNTATPTVWPPKTEMMINTDYNLGFSLGAPVATVTIDGISFNLYYQIVTPPTGTDSWPEIRYFSTTPVTQLNLNIKDFVADSVGRNYVQNADFLDVIEIGTEVRNGQGSTIVGNYNIR